MLALDINCLKDAVDIPLHVGFTFGASKQRALRDWIMAPHSKKRSRCFLYAGDCSEAAEEPERAVLECLDLLIVNKFAQEEAHGRGLRPVIAEALIAEIPQLIGVSMRNLCDVLNLVRDSATRLTPDIEAITGWCRNAIERGAHHRCQPPGPA